MVNELPVEVFTLDEIVRLHMPRSADYRLLTVDAEGLDLEVLKSADFSQQRPKIIMVEDFDFNLAAPNTLIFEHLIQLGYHPVSHCMVTTIYRDLK